MSRDRELLQLTLATANAGTKLRHSHWRPLVERISAQLAEPDPVDVLQQSLMELMTRVNLVMLELPSPHSVADLRQALEQAQQSLVATSAFKRTDDRSRPRGFFYQGVPVSQPSQPDKTRDRIRKSKAP